MDFLGPSLNLATVHPNGRVAEVGEGRLGAVEVMPTGVVARAERCEDNNPTGRYASQGCFMRLGQSAAKESDNLHTDWKSY